MKILIVDDNPEIVEVLSLMLKPYGTIVSATNGTQAVDMVHQGLASSSPFDLICMDIMMPKMDGREALREIRRLEDEYGILLGDGAKVVMITALGDSDNVFGSFHRDGCDGYVTKPFEREQVVKTMKQIGFEL